MTLTTNITAMNAAFRVLERTNARVDRAGQQLSTGLRVGNAQTDASVFAVSQGVRATIKSMSASLDVLKTLRGKFAAAENAGQEVYNNLVEMKGMLANYLEAQGNRTAQRIYQEGINGLMRDMTRVGNSTLVGQVDNELNVVATVDTPVDALDVVSDGQYIYVADLSGGVLAYTLDSGTLTLRGGDSGQCADIMA